MSDILSVYEQGASLIKASEDWAKQYEKDPETHAKLIKAESSLERTMLQYLKDLADRVPNYVDWYAYEVKLRQIHAADDFQVDVIVTDLPDSESGVIMQAVYDPIATATAIGIDAGLSIYNIPLGESDITKAVYKVARSETAWLVGKRVDRDGNIIDNPNAKYSINNTTRDKIRQSIRTSLNLGEDQAAAVSRLTKIIKDPRRAEVIASTEAVNGYQGGQFEFAKSAGAVKKEWQSLNGSDICGVFARLGAVDIDFEYTTKNGLKIKRPAAHTKCRCGTRYIWPEELQQS